MLLALPFYCGLAVTAEPLILTFLGSKWADVAALVPVLSMAMILVTLQSLFAPATNAIGEARLAVRTGLIGAVVMAGAFAIGIGWGPIGLAWAWLGGMAVLLAATVWISLPALKIRRPALTAALAPGLAAAFAMAAAVAALDSMLPELNDLLRLALLVPFGAGVYGLLLFLFARPVVDEVLELARPHRPAATAVQAL
jgi:O-antigen/teichoic acid export membrane protein